MEQMGLRVQRAFRNVADELAVQRLGHVRAAVAVHAVACGLVRKAQDGAAVQESAAVLMLRVDGHVDPDGRLVPEDDLVVLGTEKTVDLIGLDGGHYFASSATALTRFTAVWTAPAAMPRTACCSR